MIQRISCESAAKCQRFAEAQKELIEPMILGQLLLVFAVVLYLQYRKVKHGGMGGM